MDHELKNRTILLLLDGSRLISTGILQLRHRDIDELLADDNIHSKVTDLRDSGNISDEHFHLLFPPTDLSKWDVVITSHFLEHCTDLEKPLRRTLEELHELRKKGMEMYTKQEISNEECTSVWEIIVRFLERVKILLTGPIDIDINDTINRVKQAPVTPEDMDRIKSWYDLETKCKNTYTSPADTTESRSVVHDAAFHGYISTLEYMRKKFPDRIPELDKNGNLAVHFAAEGGHIECLKYMCETFPELQNEINDKGHDALYRAARGGSLDCLKYLIDQGMNTNTRSTKGYTILHAAAYGGNISMVQYILETFPNMKTDTDNNGLDVLYSAARGGSFECMKYLIRQGLSPDTRDIYGNTLLHSAAYIGSVPIVQYLCETFPYLKNEGNEKGMDAVFSAVRGGSFEYMKYLISQELSSDTRDKVGNTLLNAAAYGGSIQIVQYLCETFPYLKKEQNKNGLDPLLSAASGGNLECLKYLIGVGMDIYISDKYGDTVLHKAAYYGHEKVVWYICEHVFPLLNYKQTHGQTAIFSAVHGSHLDILKYLISQKMDAKQLDKKGLTILHAAAMNGNNDIVRYLCTSYKFLIHMKGFKGETAMDLGRRYGHLDCVNIIPEQW